MDPVEEMRASIARKHVSRRALLRTMGGVAAVGGAAALAGCTGGRNDQFSNLPSGTGPGQPPLPPTPTITDPDIFNFALNLEYLEAEFYSLATTGRTIDQAGVGVTGTGTAGGVNVKANPQVPFTTPAIRQFAEELAADEIAHVRFLRQVLGSAAVARPAIDLQASFNAAAQAAGIGPNFDPFANETNFLLGAFIFEDVGVTAYKGASPLIQNPDFLEAAAGILAVEAYHSGGIRTRVFDLGPTGHNLAQQISDLRDAADGPGDKDQGVVLNGAFNLVPSDANGVVFSRTTSEVLRIVYLTPGATPASRGGFFPNGVNGTIRTANTNS